MTSLNEKKQKYIKLQQNNDASKNNWILND